MTHEQAYHKTSKLLVNGESGCVNAWRQKRTSLWTSAKLKPALFRANTTQRAGCVCNTQPALFKATNSLPKKTRCFASRRPFYRSYLKANKINKREGISKVEYAYHFWKCADGTYQKIIEIILCLPKLQLAKVGAFFETQCIWAKL